MRLDVHFLFFAKTDARSIVKKESRKFREFPLSLQKDPKRNRRKVLSVER